MKFLARFEQHRPLRKLLRRHVRRQLIDLLAKQRREQLVVERETGI
jgi:DNA-directed RNA polymerase specialized sigma24 family protein